MEHFGLGCYIWHTFGLLFVFCKKFAIFFMDADAHWESMSTVEEIGSALPPKVTGILTTAPTTLHSGFQSKH